MRLETQDGIPVTEYQARFTGTFDVDNKFGEDMYVGKVCVWVVSASTGKFEVDGREDGTEARRKNIQTIEKAIPVTGQMRDQAIVWLSYDGEQGVVDFQGEVTEFEEEMDRLATYLKKSWPDACERFTPARIVNAVIDTLEAYKDGVPPALATVVEEAVVELPKKESSSSEPEPTTVEDGIPFEGGVFAGEKLTDESTGAVGDAIAEMDFGLEEFDVSEELAELLDKEEPVGTEETPEETPTEGAVDAAALKAMMAEGESKKTEHFKTAKVTDVPAEVDVDPELGEAVNVFAEDHEVVGSVYSPGHTGKDRDVIEGAFIP